MSETCELCKRPGGRYRAPGSAVLLCDECAAKPPTPPPAAEGEDDVQWYRKVLQRIAEALGKTDPINLIVAAREQESAADVLVRLVAEQAAALAAASARADTAQAEAEGHRRERERLQAALDETWTDERGTTWTRPTAWAYAQACRVRDAAQAEADGDWVEWEDYAALRARVARLEGAVEDAEKRCRSVGQVRIAADLRAALAPDAARKEGV